MNAGLPAMTAAAERGNLVALLVVFVAWHGYPWPFTRGGLAVPFLIAVIGPR